MEGFLFKNKYKIKSARKNGYNYSGAGFYFITICSKNKIKLFGNIVNEKMILSEYGKIVEQEWLKTFNIRKNLKLDKFVVMPNHFHGIIQIADNNFIYNNINIYSKNVVRRDVAALRLYGCEKQNKQNISKNEKMSKISPKPNSISTIIRSFKSAATKAINKKTNSNNIIWQSRFYDRIIRNDNELNKIRQYIINNPLKWDVDRNNPEYKF
jgi:REP element-mobilizing transposase RayT